MFGNVFLALLAGQVGRLQQSAKQAHSDDNTSLKYSLERVVQIQY